MGLTCDGFQIRSLGNTYATLPDSLTIWPPDRDKYLTCNAIFIFGYYNCMQYITNVTCTIQENITQHKWA